MSPQKRQLVAIMFTDIAGYTDMMQRDEAMAYAARSRHREILNAAHESHNGKVIQYYGDGTLSVFQSAVEAVDCALNMQRQFLSDPKVPVRIGLHLGDVVFSENEVYGDGVNLASRVESMALEGSILISDKLQYAIKNHNNLQTKSLGLFEFKNIIDPVEVFAICNEGILIPAHHELKGKRKENKKSIALLPFANMSADQENEYFSDGISEEILNALVKVEGLQVTARTSSFAFKGKNMDVREIGSQLSVSHILEGSVRKAGNRVRITAQLINTIDGYHFFSETYDRTLDDIFAVQDEIASTITNLLRTHLSESDRKLPMVQIATTNMEAYDLYLKGLYFSNQMADTAAMVQAIPLFEQAIELEPDFGLPYVKLLMCKFYQAFGGQTSWEEVHQLAAVTITKVKELKVDAPEIHYIQGVFHLFTTWDWNAALQCLQIGIQRFPNYAPMYHALSTLHWVSGDFESIIAIHKKGLALDPLSIEMNLYMAVGYIWNGQIELGEPYLDSVLNLSPSHRAAREYKGWVAAIRGQYDIAIRRFETLEPFGYRLHRSTCLGWVYFKQGRLTEANKMLEEMIALEKQSVNYTLDLTTLFTAAGDFDQAFFYLEKGMNHKVPNTQMIRSDHFYLGPLMKDPRWARLDEMIGKVPEFEV